MRLLTRMITVLLLTSVAMIAQATDPASVNGKPIKQSLMDYILKDGAARGQKTDDAMKAAVVTTLISQELVLQEAQKAGIEKQPDYQIKEELVRRELLINTFLQDYQKKNPIDEATIRAEFEKYKALVGDKEYSAHHILLKTEQEARDIISLLAKGSDFGNLARTKSQDLETKDKSGDLGWFVPASLVKPLADTITKLPKGLYTNIPVQTQFGWHVIKLDDIRDMKPLVYDEVKGNLVRGLQQRQMEKMVAELRSKAKIVDSTAASGKK